MKNHRDLYVYKCGEPVCVQKQKARFDCRIGLRARNEIEIDSNEQAAASKDNPPAALLGGATFFRCTVTFHWTTSFRVRTSQVEEFDCLAPNAGMIAVRAASALLLIHYIDKATDPISRGN